MEQIKKDTIYHLDLEHIFKNLEQLEKEKMRNSSILVTGCGGFLGYYFMSFSI